MIYFLFTSQLRRVKVLFATCLALCCHPQSTLSFSCVTTSCHPSFVRVHHFVHTPSYDTINPPLPLSLLRMLSPRSLPLGHSPNNPPACPRASSVSRHSFPPPPCIAEALSDLLFLIIQMIIGQEEGFSSVRCTPRFHSPLSFRRVLARLALCCVLTHTSTPLSSHPDFSLSTGQVHSPPFLRFSPRSIPRLSCVPPQRPRLTHSRHPSLEHSSLIDSNSSGPRVNPVPCAPLPLPTLSVFALPVPVSSRLVGPRSLMLPRGALLSLIDGDDAPPLPSLHVHRFPHCPRV